MDTQSQLTSMQNGDLDYNNNNRITSQKGQIGNLKSLQCIYHFLIREYPRGTSR